MAGGTMPENPAAAATVALDFRKLLLFNFESSPLNSEMPEPWLRHFRLN